MRRPQVLRGVQHAIGIVIHIGAAVLIEVMVGVLCLVRTAIAGVDDCVQIVVALGAAVLVLLAVAVLCEVRAGIVRGDVISIFRALQLRWRSHLAGLQT